MRILLAADAGSIHTERWARALAEAGDDVHVASLRAGRIEGVVVHRLPTLGLGKAGYLLAIPALKRLARAIHPDLLHAHYATSYGFLASLVGGMPLVITAWGTDTLIAPRESALLRRALRFALPRAHAVTSMAEHMNPSILALGVSAERLHVVPFGVDVPLFAAAAAVRDEALVICTRNFAPIYDVQTVIRAVAALHHRGRRVKLRLLGQGPLRPALEALAADLGVSEAVTFTGHLSQAGVAAALSESAIFVSPSQSDGNNISLNEAMAAGCFPIVTDIPANTQWIVPGETGYVYPAGDTEALAEAIARALDAPAQREAARQTNFERVERDANWINAVAHMRTIYARLLARRVT